MDASPGMERVVPQTRWHPWHLLVHYHEDQTILRVRAYRGSNKIDFQRINGLPPVARDLLPKALFLGFALTFDLQVEIKLPAEVHLRVPKDLAHERALVRFD